MAAIYAGRLYTSSDSGVTWTERQPAGAANKYWIWVATDDDGSNLFVAGVNAVPDDGRLYTSSDSGATWTERQPAGDSSLGWREVDSDSDGSNLIAAVYAGRVYTSSDSGATWSDEQPAGDANGNWFTVASNSDGSFLVAGEISGRLYSTANTAPIAGHTSNNVLGTVTQDTDGTGHINIPFRVQDANTDNCTTLGWQYSDDGGTTWNDLTAGDMTGEDGSKTSATDWSATEYTIVWTSKNQIDDTHQTDIQFQFKANDGTVDSTNFGTSASFTVDNLDPSVSGAFSPADGAADASTSGNLIITFDESVDAEAGNITIKKTSDDSTVETFDVTSDISGSGSAIITINPASDLDEQTSYYVQIDATALLNKELFERRSKGS